MDTTGRLSHLAAVSFHFYNIEKGSVQRALGKGIDVPDHVTVADNALVDGCVGRQASQNDRKGGQKQKEPHFGVGVQMVYIGTNEKKRLRV